MSSRGRDPEVGEQHPFLAGVAGEQDIGGLHITVQDVHPVRIVQCRSGFRDDLRGSDRRQGPRIHRRRIDPVDVLHGDPQLFVLVAAVEHRDDVRVIQLCHEIRLPLEASTNLVVREQLPVQQLERDLPGQARVAGLIDRTHSALPQQTFDRVPGEDVPRSQHVTPLLPRTAFGQAAMAQIKAMMVRNITAPRMASRIFMFEAIPCAGCCGGR